MYLFRTLGCFCLLCLTGCFKTQNVPDHCFPQNAVIDGTLSGDYFVGYTHPKDTEIKKNPTSPTVTMNGGAIIGGEYELKPGESSLGGITVYNKGTFVFKKGSINGYIAAYDNAKVVVSGGTNRGVIDLWDNSSASITGGTTEADVLQERKSTVTMSGGTIQGADVGQDSSFYMTGGKIIGTLTVTDKGVAEIRGGSFPPDTTLNDGTLRVVGTGLVKKLADPTKGYASRYVLSGKLADGTEIKNAEINIDNQNPGKLLLVNSGSTMPP